MTFNLVTKSVEDQSKIIKEQIIGMSVYNDENKEVYYVNLENNEIQEFKEIFEEEKIRKIGIDLSKTYILLKQEGIDDALVNLVMSSASITYEDNITIDDLNRFVSEAGFKSLGLYNENEDKDNNKTKYFAIE